MRIPLMAFTLVALLGFGTSDVGAAAAPAPLILEREHGHRVYEPGAKDASGQEKEVHLAANGKVLKVEHENG